MAGYNGMPSDKLERYLEDKTGVIAVRLPLKHVMLYDSLPKARKRVIKRVLMEVIETLSKEDVVRAENEREVNININLNIAQPAHRSIEEEETLLTTRIRRLEQKVKLAEETVKEYKSALIKIRSAIERRDLKTVSEVLKQVLP